MLSLHGKGGGSRGSLPTFARLRDLSQVLIDARVHELLRSAETSHTEGCGC